jgi:PAS domain S-box-containing protein
LIGASESGGDATDGPSNLSDKILDQAGDAVIFADRSGTIRRWNRAAAALFGFGAEEALGQSLDLIIPVHLRAAHWRGFDAAMKDGALKLMGRPTLTRGRHKSGRKLYVEMTFALVMGNGAAQGSVAVARDVTERVEREREAAAQSNLSASPRSPAGETRPTPA